MSNNQHTNCPICSDAGFTKLERYHKDHLVKCKSCKFVFASKIPTEKELTDHYEAIYTRDDYLSPITVKRFNELLDEFEPYRKTNRLLDVGCGIGYFLEVAKKRGWEVFGTEYTNDSIEICRSKGITIHEKELDPENYQPESFDIITSFEVMEHINYPVREVKNIHTLLRPGGLFYATTPNFRSFSNLRFKENWIMIYYPEHLSYYTPKTLSNLFKKNGFKKIKIQTTGIRSRNIPIPSIINESSNDEKIRELTENRKLFSLAKSLINGILTLLKRGDTIKSWFLKK